VTREDDLIHLISNVESKHGPIKLICSNAGVAMGFDLASENVAAASNEAWERSWNVNVMAHVYAARALVLRMRSRGGATS
jgi:NAD(P)-dependent dehydrogenase (short-subunit alcohol dehydrogenase family)